MGGFHPTSWSFHEEERICLQTAFRLELQHQLFPRSPVCTLLCHWVCFDSCWPYERVTSTLSCSQQPYSAPVDSCLWIFFLIHSISYLLMWHLYEFIPPNTLVFLFSYCLRFLQHYCVPFLPQRTLPSHDISKAGKLRFCHLCLQKCFRLIFTQLSRGPGYQ